MVAGSGNAEGRPAGLETRGYQGGGRRRSSPSRDRREAVARASPARARIASKGRAPGHPGGDRALRLRRYRGLELVLRGLGEANGGVRFEGTGEAELFGVLAKRGQDLFAEEADALHRVGVVDFAV